MEGKQFLEEFIELYKQNPCLWKVKSKEYCNKNMKNTAYEKLVEKLREIDPNASKETVVKKINNLRSSFRKELKKVKESSKSGAGEEDIYKPHLWYFDLLIFLTDQETPRETISNVGEEDKSEDTCTTVASPSPISLDEPEISTEALTTRSTIPKSKKKKVESSTENVLAAVSERLVKSRPEDEYDIIGKNVAEKLRRIDHTQKIFAEKIINDVLFEAQLGNLNRSCRLLTASKDWNLTAPQKEGQLSTWRTSSSCPQQEVTAENEYASTWSQSSQNAATTYFSNFDPSLQ